MRIASWQRNLYVLTVAEMVAVSGFFLITPFLPYYIQTLGVTDPAEVRAWSGWMFSAQALAMAVAAPVWGLLSDRHGRKMMVERAMFGGALVFLAMGYAQTVEQLLALRVMQGLLTGTVTAATTLVAAISPRDRSGASLGVLQTGIFLGISLGPLAGGLIADSLGYHAAFWLTSLCLVLAGMAVHWLVDEGAVQPVGPHGRRGSHLWDGVLGVFRSPALRAVVLVQMVTRMGIRVTVPLMPLFIQEITTHTDRQATVAGTIAGLAALATAAGVLVLGRVSDRIGHRQMLLISCAAIVLCFVPQSLVTNAVQLSVLQIAAGLVMAGMLAAIPALLANLSPEGRQGATYGINTSLVGGANALAPMLGVAAAVWWGLRSTFLVAAALFAVGGLVTLWLLPPSAPREPAETASQA